MTQQKPSDQLRNIFNNPDNFIITLSSKNYFDDEKFNHFILLLKDFAVEITDGRYIEKGIAGAILQSLQIFSGLVSYYNSTKDPKAQKVSNSFAEFLRVVDDIFNKDP